MNHFPTEALDDAAMQARFEANLKAFQKHQPQMYTRLHGYQPSATVVFDDTGEANVELAGTRLYGDKGARATAEEQLESYRANKGARWFVQNAPTPENLDEQATPFFMELFETLKGRVDTFKNVPVIHDSYYLFLMGVGLGPHIDAFVEETNCRHLIIIEPNLEFLFLSLKVYDWATFFEDAEDLERVVNFFISDDPAHIARQIRAAIRNINPLGLDRTCLIEHYPNSIIQTGLKKFREEEGGLTLTGLGFFDDEMIMIHNTYGNLVRGESLTFSPSAKREAMPVLVVGGGPSIDLNAEFMIENQDKMVIISCGSAIVPLLNYGIKPDFHMLLERDQLLLPLFQETAEEYDLSDIYIVASTTIPPGIGELFKKAIYFFRPGLSTFPMFCTSSQQLLPAPDPEVANAGVSFAQECGFTSFYFVGMDMGSKSSEHHHAKGAWAQTKGLGIRPQHNISIPGNFGGKVLTNPTWNWTRNSLEHALRTKSQGRTYFNLGDGAHIKGALPKRSSSVTLPKLQKTKSEVVDGLVALFPPYSIEMFDTMWKRADLYNAIPQFCEDVLETFFSFENLDDRRYQTALMKHFKPQTNTFALPMIFRGTMYQMLATIEYFRTRVQDEDKRKLFDTTAKEIFESHIRKLSETAVQQITDLEAEFAEHP